jgi:hypothetical protein
MQILLKELLAQSHKCEWLEFKENNTDKQETSFPLIIEWLATTRR